MPSLCCNPPQTPIRPPPHTHTPFWQAATIDFPASVMELLEGRLGFPHRGFPAAVTRAVLKDRKPLTVSPSAVRSLRIPTVILVFSYLQGPQATHRQPLRGKSPAERYLNLVKGKTS
jgi:hypothetical protein